MERCAGTLDDYLNSKNPKLVGSDKDILRQITNGLAYLHEKKIVHRDIKPNNILFSESTENKKAVMKLADFGISKIMKMDENFFFHLY